jgi:hypothetical protein
MGDLALALPKIEKLNLLSTSEKSSAELLLADIGKSYMYSFVQEPLDGILQLVEKCGNNAALPKFHFVERPADADFGSFRWHAQQAASAAGMLVPFFLLHRVVSNASTRFFTEIPEKVVATPSSLPGVSFQKGLLSKEYRFKTVFDSALSGSLYDGLSRPVDSNDEHFFQSRFKNALSGGLTFATLSAATCKLQLMFRSELSNAEQNAMRTTHSILAEQFKSALIAGIPAGVVAAESRSILDGKGLSSTSDLYKSCYSFAFLGGAFALASAAAHPRQLQILPARQLTPDFSEFRTASRPIESIGIRWLNKVSDDYLSNSESKHLRRVIQKFESRAERNDISHRQLNDTFQNLSRLLKGSDARHSIGVQPALCTKLLRETLENLAFPQRIDQGGHPTCVLNSIENIIASNHPEKYSRIIGDLALSGAHYYGEVGTKLPRRCLLPDAEAREEHRKDGSRSFASQLMQYYLANLHWSYGGELPDFSEAEPGTVKYQPIADGANKAALFVNGRIWKEASEDKLGTSQSSAFEAPNIQDNEVLPLFRKIVPRGKIQVIDHQNGINKWTDEYGRRTVQTVTSPEQLRKLLNDMSPNSTICGVRSERLGGDHGWHAVVLRDYDLSTDTVYLDNSWGKGHEHSGKRGEKSRISTERLFKLMTPPENED